MENKGIILMYSKNNLKIDYKDVVGLKALKGIGVYFVTIVKEKDGYKAFDEFHINKEEFNEIKRNTNVKVG